MMAFAWLQFISYLASFPKENALNYVLPQIATLINIDKCTIFTSQSFKSSYKNKYFYGAWNIFTLTDQLSTTVKFCEYNFIL